METTPEPSLFHVKYLMDAHRNIQCAELLRRCLQALVNTPHLESFRHGQTTLHMHIQLRRASDTVS